MDVRGYFYRFIEVVNRILLFMVVGINVHFMFLNQKVYFFYEQVNQCHCEYFSSYFMVAVGSCYNFIWQENSVLCFTSIGLLRKNLFLCKIM